MARKKSPENETAAERAERHRFEAISNVANRSEKTSWNRKLGKLVKLRAQLEPLEIQIHEIMKQKRPIQDEIELLRQHMVRECIHPFEYLTTKHTEDPSTGSGTAVIVCKFCEALVTPTAHDSKTT